MEQVTKVENRVHVKDPAAVKDYRFDWAAEWLIGGDTISGHSIVADAGIVVDSSFHDGTGGIVVWLSGGEAGVSYTVVCQVTSGAGRIDERSMLVRVRDL